MPTWDMRLAMPLPLTLLRKEQWAREQAAALERCMGNEFATKGGVGSASIDLGDGLIVSALMVGQCGW